MSGSNQLGNKKGNFPLERGGGSPRSSGVVQSPPIPGSYRVVARVEDFETIIGRYHNNSTRHPGIQKTYSRVSVLCMRMQ